MLINYHYGYEIITIMGFIINLLKVTVVKKTCFLVNSGRLLNDINEFMNAENIY